LSTITQQHLYLSVGRPLVLGESSATNTATEPAEDNAALFVNHGLEVSLSPLEGHALDSLGGFTRVLEVNTHVRALGLGHLAIDLPSVLRHDCPVVRRN